MSVIVSTLKSLPYTQFRRTRSFYFWYDGVYAVLCASLLLLFRWMDHKPLLGTFDWWMLAAVPLVCHVQILCSVYVHNATHNNFPRALNRLVGELCGIVVLTRFASWEIIHQRHHRYSDDVDRDPHPVVSSYWVFLFKTIVGVERQLQRIFMETYGDNEENRRHEKIRAITSFGTGVLLIACWYVFLGPVAFFVFFVPATVVGFLHLIHFNWSTHNAFSKSGDFKPVNLNHGYYKIGNWIWHGIYMHANHHIKANLFNPAKVDLGAPITVPDR